MTNLNSKKFGQIFKIPLLALVFATIFVYIALAVVSTPISSVVLNTTSGGNYTYENLTAYPSPFNSSQFYIYDWRVNGSSVAILNLPIEGEDAQDYSTYAHNITLNGVTYNATGDMNGGGSYSFDGVNDSIDIDYHPSFLDRTFTISLWAKIPAGYAIPSSGGGGNQGGYLISMSSDNYNWNIELDGSKDIYFDTGGSGGARIFKLNMLSDFNDSVWHHYAATMDNTTNISKIYFDGVEIVNSTEGIVSFSDTGKLLIGKRKDNAAGFSIQANMSDIFIFNQSLDPESIEELYNFNYDKIISSRTSVGEIWDVNVTPVDGIDIGTSVLSNSVTIMPDISAPTIIINTPINNSIINDSTPELNVTFSGETVAYTWYNVNNTGNSTPQANTADLTVTLSSLPDGLHNVTVYANDSSENLNSSIVYFTVDATLPIPTFASPTPADNSNLSQSYIDINVTVDETNLKNVTVYLFNSTSPVNFNVSMSTPLVYNFTGLDDGTYYINATAYDTAGNSNVTETRTIVLDTISPIATFESPTPADNSILSQSYIDTNVTVTETNLKNITAYIYNSTDLVVSNVSMSTPLVYNFTGLDDGTYYINATAYDDAGNSNTTETRTIVLDATLPVATFVSPTPADNSNLSQNYIDTNVTVTETNFKNITTYIYNSTDLVGSNVSMSTPLVYNFTGLDDGTYYINATAYDDAGNSNTTETRTIVLDATLPIATFELPTPVDNSILSQSYIDINVTVVETNLKNITAYIYNSTDLVVSNVSMSTPLLYNFTGLDDRTYYINATAYDDAGNSNTTETRTIVLDATLPIATFESPTPVDNSNLSQSYIDTNVTVTETNLKNVTVYLFNSTSPVAFNVSMSTPLVYNFTGLDDGTYYINATAYDDAGNSNITETRTIVLDTISPIATFESPTPADNSILSQSYIDTNVTVVETNLKNITAYIYNSTDLVVSNVSMSTPLLYNFTGLDDGTYYINATAYDDAGNSNTTETRTIVLDTTLPIATFASPTPADNSNLSQSYIDTNVTVVETNLKNITAYIYNSTDLVVSNVSMSSPLLYNFTGLDDGTYYINATAYDDAGNSNTTETRTILLDTIPPIAPTITMPSDGSTLTISTTWVNGTTSADTTNVTVYVDGSITNDSVVVSGITYNISNVPLGADGSHEINVSAMDSVGNVNTTNATAIVTVDTKAPTAPTNLVHTDADVSKDNYDNDNSTDISWSASIDVSNVTYNIYRDGVLNDSTPSLAYTFTNETEGEHTYNVSAIDAIGNINTTNASVTVIVDLTDPVIHNVSLSDYSPSYDQPIVVSVNVTDTNIGSVVAGGRLLDQQSGLLWNGTITAGYGTNTVTVTAYDNASRSATNTSLTYTGPAEPTDDSSSGPVNLPNPLPENVVDKEVKGSVFSEPVASADLKFNKGYITLITVDAKGMISEVMITVQKLAGKPSEIKVAPPSGAVHTYHNIDMGRIENDDLAGATIKFKAEKKWIAENGGDRNAVVVMRYHDSWMALETNPIGEDDEYVFFSARTPGFSTFAITIELDEEVAPVEVQTPEPVVEEVDEPAPVQVEPEEETSYWWLILVMAAIVVVGVVIFVYKNKKDESEE